MRMSLEEIFLHLTTEESAGGGSPMRNILAIARKELRSYFASPIAYVVIGLFALLFGYFFYAILMLLRPAEHADGPVGMGGPVQRQPADDPAAAAERRA